MKKAFVWCSVVLMSLMVAAQAQDKKMGGTEQTVAALEQQWTDAGKASNSEAIAPLLAEKYVNTLSDGTVVGKAETLAHTNASKWETNQISGVKVTVFGDTAIATGEWKGKGTDDDGKPVNTGERFTDTWMKTSGEKMAMHRKPRFHDQDVGNPCENASSLNTRTNNR